MKPLRRHLKLIALFLAVTFLMQSCSVCNYKPTTLDNALKTYKSTTIDGTVKGKCIKTKVKTQHRTYVFTKMEKENEQVFGYEKRNTGYNKIPLEQFQTIEIYTQRKDKTLSIILPVVGPLVFITMTFPYIGY